MFRYVAFVWEPTNHDQQHAVHEMMTRLHSSRCHWRVAYQACGLRVLCTGERHSRGECHLLQEQQGVVLGTVFQRSRDVHEHQPDFDLTASAHIAETQGLDLVENYWGSYVALIYDTRAAITSVLRSPVGNLPCLTAEASGVHLFFSYLPDCIDLRGLRLSINWDYVARHLLKFNDDSNETGVREVAVLPGGHCVRMQAGRRATLVYWDARTISQGQQIVSEVEASEAVRTVTSACIRAWSSRHDVILHKLSGGLDSSIVLGCLQEVRTPESITSLTYYGLDSASCDERVYARLSASRAGSELVESYLDPNVDLSVALQDKASETPPAYRARAAYASFERDLARAKGASAIFSGDGGDEIFLRSSRLASADYVAVRGIDRQLIDALLHRCERESISFWKATREAVYNGWFVRELDVLKGRRKLQIHVNGNLIENLRRHSRASSNGRARRVPLGKQYQIRHSLAPAPYYEALSQPGDPESVTPLVSQPLIEICLRIPTYVLTHGGWDRAIARRAFTAQVPAEILRRQEKGGAEATVMQLLQSNLDLARDLLLDGNLVRREFLNRRTLEDALSDRPSVELKAPVQILRYLSTELWLRVATAHGIALAA